MLLLSLGLLAAAPGVVYLFVWPGNARRIEPVPSEASTVEGPPSIAVLAFADLSPGKDQEYFSDGIAEEILNVLARVRGLKVAGRTSSFHFKGRNEDLHAIGAALGVQNVLEGSVRKQGNRVRITAQLIKAKDGFHLWSRTYDGELTDVFELQERIARAITEELKVVLQGDPQARLVPVATRNPEAYALYLQATAIFNRRDGTRFADAVVQLEQALRLDPAFARAHSRLAALHAILPSYTARDVGVAMAAAEKHARRAIELDAALAEPHAVLGLLLSHQRRWEDERVAFQRALALDPDDVTANFWFATTLVAVGYGRQGAEVLARGIFGEGESRAKAVALVDAYLATRPAVVAGIAPYALLRLGQSERSLAIVEGEPTANDALFFGVLWGPFGRVARTSPGFPEFARKVGFADLWDRHGPADGCRRVAPRDYRCD